MEVNNKSKADILVEFEGISESRMEIKANESFCPDNEFKRIDILDVSIKEPEDGPR